MNIVIVINGVSGCGKSTMISLVKRMYEGLTYDSPWAGAVQLNNGVTKTKWTIRKVESVSTIEPYSRMLCNLLHSDIDISNMDYDKMSEYLRGPKERNQLVALKDLLERHYPGISNRHAIDKITSASETTDVNIYFVSIRESKQIADFVKQYQDKKLGIVHTILIRRSNVKPTDGIGIDEVETYNYDHRITNDGTEIGFVRKIIPVMRDIILMEGL